MLWKRWAPTFPLTLLVATGKWGEDVYCTGNRELSLSMGRLYLWVQACQV